MQHIEDDVIREDQEFEVISDHLADKLKMYVGDTVPVLSDYAVSGAEIYEEHF